ncbi:hypothetical protein OUZ56_024118 [Daphnia magna]|uniref:C2H2-type domain-containing protein n=1 Tax=Daphnia magna TaxID=35525 RepID=A0ABR0B0I1_9CRUS|nr:hypothetical protein OUZ56_024118 [Daphnia magna]
MKGLVNKNPVEESETDLLPHNGNELEQHSSTSAYDTMSTADSCTSTVLLSCLASQPEHEPQSEIDHHLSTSFYYTMYYQNSCTNTLLSSCLEQMEMATSIHIEALQGEIVTEQQPSSKKKKDEAAEGEKAQNLWKEKQEDVYKAFVTSHASSAHGRMCSSDGCLNSLFDHHMRCDDCKRHFCHSCDKSIHFRLPFHKRIWLNTESSKRFQYQYLFLQLSKSVNRLLFRMLLETTFVSSLLRMLNNLITNSQEALFRCNSCECTFDATLDDCILSGFWPPMPDKFTFLCCSQLLTLGHHLKLLTPGTSEQKFLETNSAMLVEGSRGETFVCDTCNSLTKATIDDYVFSGFFPASLSETVTYLFSEEALLLCLHLSHKCPGSSKNMYAHTLEEVSKEYERTGPINIPLFTTAEREWETCRHYIDQEVFKRNKIDCPSCGTKPLMRSSDAIIKLRRLASAGKARKQENERVMDDVESRFENLVIKSDVEVESFRQRIYNKVQTSKKKNMCGGSAFKAAREDSNENKKYDKTGLVVSSCKHCIVPVGHFLLKVVSTMS